MVPEASRTNRRGRGTVRMSGKNKLTYPRRHKASQAAPKVNCGNAMKDKGTHVLKTQEVNFDTVLI